MLKLIKAFGLCNILTKAGYEAYIVGGAVRDSLLNRPISDVDIATNARPNQVAEVFRSTPFTAIPTGEKFGTMTIIIDDDDGRGPEKIEITTYRSEGKYSDRRHPDEVTFEDSLDKDLSRRDFTVNAMALNGVKLIDPFRGYRDLDNHIIRTVGVPEERFREDPLRMIRMCRFACKLGFIINKETYDAAKALSHLIVEIPMERIKDELFKIFAIENPHWALSYLEGTGLMEQLLPEVTRLKHVVQPKPHEHTVMYHMFETVRHIPSSKPLLRFVGLIHDCGKRKANDSKPYFPKHHLDGVEIASNIVERFKFSNEEAKYILFMVKHHMDVHFNKAMTSRGARRYLSKLENPDWVSDIVVHANADIIACGSPFVRSAFENTRKFEVKLLKVRVAKQPFRIKDLRINGYDIMDLGIEAGPLIGKIQKTLLDEVVERPRLNRRTYLLKRAREILNDR